MPATIKMDINQVKVLISQFSIKEKEDLARYLDSLTLKKRFKRLLSAKKDIPISYEEITKEVEKVRAARYK
ncbi:MAG: hypothetical protein Q8P40_06550 [Nitrospirota bacterium]|jgi:hypothetical protein|nr:hypothetical protein [Nitrospirota bacterium]